MRGWMRALLIIEAIVCFGPATAFLALGAMMIPMQLRYLAENPLLWEGSMLLVPSVVGGAVGLCSLLYVLSALVDRRRVQRPVLALGGVIAGLLSIVQLVNPIELIRNPVELIGSPIALIGVLPVLSTAHILFLSRRLLLPLPRTPPEARPRLWGIGALVLLSIAGGTSFYLTSIYHSSDELMQRHAFWMNNRPRSYSYEFHPAGWFEDRNIGYPRTITVHGDKLVTAAHLGSPGPLGEKRPPAIESAWTMDMIFEQLIRAASDGAGVRAQFDERWGYVRRVYVDYDDANASWHLTVNGFVAE